jgi:hypothetical protein
MFASPSPASDTDAGSVPQVLALAEADPRRPALEAMLMRMALDDLADLHDRTRSAAREARAAADMPRLFDLVRGMKTLQRIAGARGRLLMAPPLRQR